MTDPTQAALVERLGEAGARIVADASDRLAEGGADALAKELLITLSTALSTAKHSHELERRLAAVENVLRVTGKLGPS